MRENYRLVRNDEVLQHLMQNNHAQPVSKAVGVFEERLYDYLLEGLAGITPKALQELESILPDELAEAEKLQILNCPPKTLPQLYSCIYDAQNRFSYDVMQELEDNIERICGFESE